MRKHILIISTILSLSLLFCGCKDNNTDSTAQNISEETDSTTTNQETQESIFDDDYYTNFEENYVEKGGEIAFLSDSDIIKDGGYQQAIYEGIQSYAYSANVLYSYYSPTDSNTSSYFDAMDLAIENNAKLIVCSSGNYNSIIGQYQSQYPDIDFLMVDGVPKDKNDNTISPTKNVHCMTFEAETAGYLAGYLAVMDGYTHLGFIGGVDVDPVVHYGYGFIQGIDAAARTKGISDKVVLDYWYSNTFSPSDTVYEKASAWYKDGCEIIFSCGGSICTSVIEAADANNGLIIGVDVDQSGLSDRIVTSATKGVDTAVITALDEYYAYEGWPDELSGQIVDYGIDDWCTNLPTDDEAWRFKNITQDDYMDIYLRIKSDEISVSSDISKFPTASITISKH